MGGGDVPSTFEAREGGAYGEEADDEAVRSGRALAWIVEGDVAPMPGDPVQVRDFVAALEAKAAEVRDYTGEVSRLTPEWTGTTADSFMVLKDTLPPKMELIAERFEAVAAALGAYADELEIAQDDADGAVQAALTARGNLEDAETDRDHAEAELDGRTVEEWKEENEGEVFPYSEDFETDLTDAQDALLDAWNDFKAAYSSRWTAAETCQEAIADAINDDSTTGWLNDSVPDRQQEGTDAAIELQGLIDDGASEEEIQAWAATLQEHEGDTAFAVAFSEELGAAGYLDATEEIRKAFDIEDSYTDPDEALEIIALLGGTLTTALDTVERPYGGYINEDNANLPGDLRLDSDFASDLAHIETSSQYWETDSRDLAALMSNTQLPSHVLVTMADKNLNFNEGYSPSPWGEDLDANSVYQQLLIDDPVAAAHWTFNDGHYLAEYTEGGNNLAVLLETTDSEAASEIFTAAFVEGPQTDPSLYDAGLNSYADAVRLIGEGDISNPAKIAAADALEVYIDDIGRHATLVSEGDYSRPDMVAFFAELAYSPDAIEKVGETITFWGGQRILNMADDESLGTVTVDNDALKPVAAMTGVVMDGLDITHADKEAANDGWASGLTEGGLMLIAGGLVLLPEPGSTAAGVALASGAVAARDQVGQLGDSVRDNVEGGATGGDFNIRGIEAIKLGVAQTIADERGIEMPEIPSAGERGEIDLEDQWPEELESILGDFGEPITTLREYSLDERDNYDNPTEQDWGSW
jgi:uncharacterized protein YukE